MPSGKEKQEYFAGASFKENMCTAKGTPHNHQSINLGVVIVVVTSLVLVEGLEVSRTGAGGLLVGERVGTLVTRVRSRGQF